MQAAYTRIMTDYPDWQTFPNAQSDNLFASFTQTLTPGTHSTAVLPALSWSSIMIAVTATAGAAQVQLNHFADAAGTQQIDSDNWPFNPSTNLRVRSPLRGKYVRLDIIVTSAGNLTVNSWANFLSASSERISFPVSQQSLSAFNFTLTAGATQTAQIGEIAAGMASFFYNPYDSAGKVLVYIRSVSELGTGGSLITEYGTPTALIRDLLTVPDQIIQVVFTNNDGVASHSFDFALPVPPQ